MFKQPVELNRCYFTCKTVVLWYCVCLYFQYCALVACQATAMNPCGLQQYIIICLPFLLVS